uniref:Uncharacterized protein n=1 Tax=Neogobius melanostomus TaxID=47308 RepID=A0A8C6WPV5_9GOBI
MWTDAIWRSQSKADACLVETNKNDSAALDGASGIQQCRTLLSLESCLAGGRGPGGSLHTLTPEKRSRLQQVIDVDVIGQSCVGSHK